MMGGSSCDQTQTSTDAYYETSLNKEDAIKREKSLKTGFDRASLKRRLKNFLTGEIANMVYPAPKRSLVQE